MALEGLGMVRWTLGAVLWDILVALRTTVALLSLSGALEHVDVVMPDGRAGQGGY